MNRRLTGLAALAILAAACSGTGSGEPSTAPETASTASDSQAAAADDGAAPPPGTNVPQGSSGDGYGVCWASPVEGVAAPELTFTDLTAESGLEAALIGMRGHAAAWGDIDGDLQVDLVVGTFATGRSNVYEVRGATGPSPDAALLNSEAEFAPLPAMPEQYGRTSGAALVDLDGDGDLDLALSRNVNARSGGDASAVFENTGAGFALADHGIDPELGGRSIGVIDIDRDQLLDLVIVEDRYQGGSTQVYRNLGGLAFEEASAAFGFPADVHGLGVAVGDLNNDGLSDVFVAGSNRLFLGSGSGLIEATGAVAEWPVFGPEDDVSGAAIADVDRDGRLDLLVGHHFNSTLSQGNAVPVRLYLNSGTSGETPTFEDVTEVAGLSGIPTKAPHVELADMNNDGWPDVVTSASAAGGTQPAVFLHQGLVDGVPRFSTPDGLGDAQYWVSGPTADVDRDGRLDILGVEWNPALPSILFHNTGTSGNWIEVSVSDAVGGVGSRVEVFRAGAAGDPASLLGVREITATVGYTAGVELLAHFGLGEDTEADVVVRPAGGERVVLPSVAANQHVRLGGCG